MSSEKYTIVEDDLCNWNLKEDGVIVARSITPLPLLNHALEKKLLPLSEVLELARTLGVSATAMRSLSELEDK